MSQTRSPQPDAHGIGSTSTETRGAAISAQPPQPDPLAAGLPAVEAPIGYIDSGLERAEVRVYPPDSGLEIVRPTPADRAMAILDARPAADRLSLDEHGFELHAHGSAFDDFYNEAEVRAHYYPEVELTVRDLTGAAAVIVFDHNVRSAVRAARGEPGVREPVDQAHNDYTEQSGPERQRAVLEAANRTDLADRHFAFVNLWRPIIGPIVDTPLAVCDARSVANRDLIPTDIHHFGEDDLEAPRHSGHVYSLRHNPRHRWFYASDMQPDEMLLLKCYDSRTDGRARFMPHTGFRNPACPTDYTPRESIEARTLVVFDAQR